MIGSESVIDWTQDIEAGFSNEANRAPVIFAAKSVSDSQSAWEVMATRLDLESEIVRELGELLSPSERLRASRFAFDLDRNRFIVARARLRQFLAIRLDVPPASVELIFGRRGKPALAPRLACSGLRFNVSHSEDVAVYAFAFQCEVGIDVEAIRAIKYADSIATRLFSKFENDVYHALEPENKVLGFFNCWTRKEAFIKALGEGLYYRLDRFDVSLAPGDPVKILRVEEKCGNDCGWHLNAFCPAPGYVAAIVTEI